MSIKPSFFYKTLGATITAASSVGGVVFGAIEKQKNSSLSKEIEELNKKSENQEINKLASENKTLKETKSRQETEISNLKIANGSMKVSNDNFITKIAEQEKEIEQLKSGNENDYTSMAKYICMSYATLQENGWDNYSAGFGRGSYSWKHVSFIVKEETGGKLRPLKSVEEVNVKAATLKEHKQWADDYLKTKGRSC